MPVSDLAAEGEDNGKRGKWGRRALVVYIIIWGVVGSSIHTYTILYRCRHLLNWTCISLSLIDQ